MLFTKKDMEAVVFSRNYGKQAKKLYLIMAVFVLLAVIIAVAAGNAGQILAILLLIASVAVLIRRIRRDSRSNTDAAKSLFESLPEEMRDGVL